MKRIRLAFAALLAAVFILSSLISCYGGLIEIRTTAPETTAPPVVSTESVFKKALADLSEMADGFSPARSVTVIRCTDPRIGVPLTAETELTSSGDLLTLTYGYDRLNPIGSPEMVSYETGTLSGSPEELRAELENLYLWGLDPEGVLLLSLDFPEAAFREVSLDEGVLLASVRDDAIASVVGSDLGGASSLTVSLAFGDGAFSSLSLSYLLGEASISVTVTFSDK